MDHSDGCGDNSPHGILLAVDRHQRIVGADRYAQAVFSNSRLKLEEGFNLWTLWEKDQMAFRNKVVGDTAVALKSVRSAQLWSALITPPYSADSHIHNAEYENLHSSPSLDSIGYFCRSNPRGSWRGGLTPRALRRVCAFIDAHLGDPLELKVLAETAGLSRCYFARAFKQSVGTSPHSYLMKRKLEKAQRLLTESNLSLAEIALESGFSDQSHFSRRFLQHCGMTPRSFRWSKR